MSTEQKNQSVIVLNEAERVRYGGQAVVEGVMMRSPRFFAVACRRPSGSIVVQCEEVDKSLLGKLKFLNKPFLRGTLGILDAMILGSRALNFASKVQLEDASTIKSAAPLPATTPSPSAPVAKPTETNRAGSKINEIAVGGTILISLLFGLFVFRLIPTVLGEKLANVGIIGSAPTNLMKNALDGAIRACFFFAYILAISRMAGIRAVFQYHGAEHKAINTLEAGVPLTRENALEASRIHPRCGTSFIVVVMVVDFLLCLFLPRPELFRRVLLHIAMLPPVAGIAYEAIKVAGKYRHNRMMMAAFAPGMWTQHLTTRVPNAAQVDVALAALFAVLEAEGHTVPAHTKPQEMEEVIFS
ncbi:MAG: DUF1385 domain-containing protein [Armatimonadetes bacterium]|nr:DUF1385 domain-containing protein [Armatimonadota bacterium]